MYSLNAMIPRLTQEGEEGGETEGNKVCFLTLGVSFGVGVRGKRGGYCSYITIGEGEGDFVPI